MSTINITIPQKLSNDYGNYILGTFPEVIAIIHNDFKVLADILKLPDVDADGIAHIKKEVTSFDLLSIGKVCFALTRYETLKFGKCSQLTKNFMAIVCNAAIEAADAGLKEIGL